MRNLPLSWIYSPSHPFQIKPINLLDKNFIWLALAISPTLNFINEIKNGCGVNKILIRGCDEKISEVLFEYGYKRIYSGQEAVLNFSTNHFKKKSLRHLIRRGSRHGKIIEYIYSINVADKLQQFKRQCSHAHEPQLKNLFCTEFSDQMKLYVFEDHRKEWLGAVMVSRNSETKLHTELLLRKWNAPVGIMESLIFHIFENLKNNGIIELSLGEVPFIMSKNRDNISIKDHIINRIGKSLRCVYNYKGLYNFKNKFNPEWNDIYICGKPNISFINLFLLSLRTNFFRLLLYKLFKK